MTLSTEVKKLTESKPFYVVAGVGDYAVEVLRGLPEQIEKLQTRGVRETGNLPVLAKEYAAKAEGYARDLPDKAKDYADDVSTRVTGLYEEFARRGRKVVRRVSGDAASELEGVSQAAGARPAARRTNGRATGSRTTTTTRTATRTTRTTKPAPAKATQATSAKTANGRSSTK